MSIFYKIFFVLLLWTIAFPRQWYKVEANSQKSYLFTKHLLSSIVKPEFHDVELNDSSVTMELIANGVLLPNAGILQAHAETDYYRSYKCIHKKNLFGIKPHKCKYVKGEYELQAVYDSYKDCIACYAEIQDYYLKAINGKYAQNPNYVPMLKNMPTWIAKK